MIFRSLIFSLIFLYNSVHSSNVEEMEVEVKLNDNYTVRWHLENNQTIQFGVVASIGDYKVSGAYVGFGISNSGGMRGADILAIIVLPNDTVILRDMYGVANERPLIDANQDYKLQSHRFNNGQISVNFSRLIDTCDMQDVKITENTQYLIWSLGQLNITNNQSETRILYHGPGSKARGAKAVNLLDPIFEVPDISKYQVLELHQDIVIQPERTLYWCKFHKIPDLGKKHHIVGFGINRKDPTSYENAHHASILSCSVPEGASNSDPDDYFGPYVNDEGYDCVYSESGAPINDCKQFDFQWAYGGDFTMLPQNVGVPFGNEQKTYYMTMLHIDNPANETGKAFKSGLDLFYTDQLREFDAGFFQIGINSTKAYSLTIPPNSTDYNLSSHCPSQCTAGLPQEGVNVFVYLLHFHLTGRKMRVRHFRNGTELPWIANDENYDTNYQNNRMLRQQVTLLPQDHLTVECVFDSTDRKGEVVIGGRGLFDEMCQAFLMYYPKVQSINRCGSGYPQEEMLKFMGIDRAVLEKGGNDPTVIEPEMWRNLKYTEVVGKQIEWTPEKRREFQNITMNGNHQAECSAELGKGVTILTKYPQYDKPYRPPSVCDKKNSSSRNHLELVIFIFVLIFKYFV